MRMMLDFVVYVQMVAVISILVLFHSSASTDGGVPEDNDFVEREFSSRESACAMVFILVSRQLVLDIPISCNKSKFGTLAGGMRDD